MLSQTSEFVTYYALPYVPNPLEHKSFKHLFTREFVAQLRRKVEDFANSQASKISESLSEPRIIQRLTQRHDSHQLRAKMEAVSLENLKLKKALEELKDRLMASYEKESAIDRLVNDFDSPITLAKDIMAVLKGEPAAQLGVRQQFRERFSSHKKAYQIPIDLNDQQSDPVEEEEEPDEASEEIGPSTLNKGRLNPS